MKWLAILIICACPMAPGARAMNWEGHDDDWMLDMPHATAFEEAVGHLPKIRRELPCVPPENIGKPRENVYDQVPLRKHACKAPEVNESR
jgi:hypothetical protein